MAKKKKYPWDQCIADRIADGYDKDSATKICASIRQKNMPKKKKAKGSEEEGTAASTYDVERVMLVLLELLRYRDNLAWNDKMAVENEKEAENTEELSILNEVIPKLKDLLSTEVEDELSAASMVKEALDDLGLDIPEKTEASIQHSSEDFEKIYKEISGGGSAYKAD